MATAVNIGTPLNPTVLQNKGFSINLYKLDEKGDIVFGPEGPEYEIFWFKFTNGLLATMEEPDPYGFETVEQWGEALETAPFKTVSKTFALALNYMTKDERYPAAIPDVRRAGNRLIDGKIVEYVTVLSGALQMAQGVDPEASGELVLLGLQESKKTFEAAKKEVEAAVAEARKDAANLGTPMPPSTGSPSAPGHEDGQS